jgi:hypothetical protein
MPQTGRGTERRLASDVRLCGESEGLPLAVLPGRVQGVGLDGAGARPVAGGLGQRGARC